MDAHYEIDADPSRGMIRVRLSGFFGIEDVRSFGMRYREELARLPGPGHLTLADIRAMKIQAQDIVTAFSRFMASPDTRSRKLAFVCASNLARLQAQRLTDRAEVRFFNDANAAEAWLMQ
ncbi:MAG: STAS/SEC14 domain-containing protein [Pseudomonadota bacterium]|uniref:STAS/SEC14 domain-containing protein n=1 Tax=Sphingobium naphthae TaxID=1886786 RepID=UPI002B13AADE|nr:STAS/SEC14 domain-containing protein [Pseudomonadota bacterium]